jgi:hypothetical protein
VGRKMKYILGGGIAGLIFAFFNKDFKIITKDIGGQFNNYFDLGPRYLEDIPESRKFLTLLNIPIKQRTIYVGYKNCKNITYKKYGQDKAKKYYHKSRGISEDPQQTFMNDQKSKMQVLDVNFKSLINKLEEQLTNRIIPANILKIDLNEKEIITDNGIFEYSELVSTIPLNVFLKFIQKPNESYKTQDITYVLLNKNFINMDDFDFVYCCDDEPYHRLTLTNEGIIADVLGSKTQEEIKKFFPKYIDYKVIKGIQIISGKPLYNYEDIKLFGRYGTWDRTYKTEKVIQEAMAYGKI